MGRGVFCVWGEKAQIGSWDNRLRFPGQYYDNETGNYYNYFRDYSPAIGRYLQADPIGLDGGFNVYAYVGGNPIVRFDSNGKIVGVGNIVVGVGVGFINALLNYGVNAGNECVPASDHLLAGFLGGFASGFIAGFTLNPVAIGAIGGAFTNGLNSHFSGQSTSHTINSAIIGGFLGGVVGGGAGAVVASNVSGPTSGLAGAVAAVAAENVGNAATSLGGFGCQCP